MALFNNETEQERKRKLSDLEDKRVAFAEKMQAKGFAPETMLLASTEKGGLCALAKHDGALYLVTGPDFGGEGDFELCEIDPAAIRFEKYYQAAEGMGGIFGFGRKMQDGFFMQVSKDGEDLSIPFVINRNSSLVCTLKKNPLLNPKRRRGNANVVWDMIPIDKSQLVKTRKAITEIVGTEID